MLKKAGAMSEIAERVMALLAEAHYRPITLKAMSRQLEVEPAHYPEFRRAVRDLIREGKVHLSRDKALRLPDRKGLLTGLFRRTAKGFGFVRPHHVAGGIDQSTSLPRPAAMP
jgi:ribonuclease R